MCLQPVPDYAAGQSIYSNGVTIAQVACNGSPEQQWQLHYLGEAPHPTCSECNYGALYYVVNLVSGQCVDVTDAATYDGARIQQWACNSGGSEKWRVGFYYSHGGYRWREFINSRTKKCLDVPGDTSSQVALQQYGCNGTTAQIFSMW